MTDEEYQAQAEEEFTQKTLWIHRWAIRWCAVVVIAFVLWFLTVGL